MGRLLSVVGIVVLQRLRTILLWLAGATLALAAAALLQSDLVGAWDWPFFARSNLGPILSTAGLLGLLGSLLVLYVRSYYHDRAVAWEVSQRDRVSIVLVVVLLGSALYWMLLGAS